MQFTTCVNPKQPCREAWLLVRIVMKRWKLLWGPEENVFMKMWLPMLVATCWDSREQRQLERGGGVEVGCMNCFLIWDLCTVDYMLVWRLFQSLEACKCCAQPSNSLEGLRFVLFIFWLTVGEESDGPESLLVELSTQIVSEKINCKSCKALF